MQAVICSVLLIILQLSPLMSFRMTESFPRGPVGTEGLQGGIDTSHLAYKCEQN
jgi:hypothetical protein